MLEHEPPQTQPELKLHCLSDFSAEEVEEEIIEDYLDHVFAPLVGIVKYSDRQDMRDEMRTHLVSLIAAHEELGGTREESLSAALKQMGEAHQIAQHWRRVLPSEESITTQADSGRSIKEAFTAFGFAYFLPGMVNFYIRMPDHVAFNENYAAWTIFLALALSGLPIVVSGVLGWRNRFPSLRSIVIAHTATVATTFVLTDFLAHQFRFNYFGIGSTIHGLGGAILQMIALQTPACLAGAGIGHLWRKWKERRIRQYALQ